MLTEHFEIRCRQCGASEDTQIKAAPTEKDGVGRPGWLVLIYCPQCGNTELIGQQKGPKPDCG
jgi:uncharacterized Zn finger protein